MLHSLHGILDCSKVAARWEYYEISEIQKWHRCYAVTQALLDRYQSEGVDFLGRIVAMNEPNLKRQSYEWKHPCSPRPQEVRLTERAAKVMFVVAYDINGFILHHTVSPRQIVNAA